MSECSASALQLAAEAVTRERGGDRELRDRARRNDPDISEPR